MRTATEPTGPRRRRKTGFVKGRKEAGNCKGPQPSVWPSLYLTLNSEGKKGKTHFGCPHLNSIVTPPPPTFPLFALLQIPRLTL